MENKFATVLLSTKSADLKDKFLFLSFAELSELPSCRERLQIAICSLELLTILKCLASGLDASLSFLSTSRRCSRNQSPSRLPISPMYNFMQ